MKIYGHQNCLYLENVLYVMTIESLRDLPGITSQIRDSDPTAPLARTR